MFRVEIDVRHVAVLQLVDRAGVEPALEEQRALVVADAVEGVGRLQSQQVAVVTNVRRRVTETVALFDLAIQLKGQAESRRTHALAKFRSKIDGSQLVGSQPKNSTRGFATRNKFLVHPAKCTENSWKNPPIVGKLQAKKFQAKKSKMYEKCKILLKIP